MINCHPICRTSSRSHVAFANPLIVLVITVSRFPREKAAVFIPMPKRPRSLDGRISPGSAEPMRMFLIRESASIPNPLSEMTIRRRSQSNVISIFVASAEMLLSMISAIAASSVYPTERRDISNSRASGMDSISSGISSTTLIFHDLAIRYALQ